MPDTRLDAQLASWRRQLGRAIDALHVTWICCHVPTIAHLVDLSSPDARVSTHMTATHVFVLGLPLPIRRYQYQREPALRAAYDPKTQTLYYLT